MLELKIGLFLFFIIICVLALFIRNYIRVYSARKESTRQLLHSAWRLAREHRQQWYEDHRSFFDFYHDEYQRLWDIEIGAEVLYIFHEQGFLRRLTRHVHISWDGYKAEKHSFDTQKT